MLTLLLWNNDSIYQTTQQDELAYKHSTEATTHDPILIRLLIDSPQGRWCNVNLCMTKNSIKRELSHKLPRKSGFKHLQSNHN